ncbi:MAG: bifunctional phosphopantothenoylcysteine decarboxylase/phosphopantothenate--cysteine ligase CoaBC [Lysobacterales bacterium]
MQAPPVSNKHLLLGVTGGIAAYKACELTRQLIAAGFEVQVVMTAGAEAFVTPQTFQALSGRSVRRELFDPAAEAAMGHIELARWADRILIAPATAHCIAQLAHGLAPDLLGTLCLASSAPLYLAPAMNQQMWAHPATQANIALLRRRGVHFFGPAEGEQACGEFGPGRMLEPDAILAALLADRARSGLLSGRRVLVNAGPTYEDLDPARFIGNRSSGRMGFAIAAEAVAMGAEVVLVAGPVALPTPAGVRRIDVRSAAEMRKAVLAAVPGHDLFVAAAAVADYRPAAVSVCKLKRSAASLHLELLPNPDIVAEVAALETRPFVVGFAAETDDPLVHARAKRIAKRLDLIAANRIACGAVGFESEENQLTLIWADGELALPRSSKSVQARALLAHVAALLGPAAASE